MHREILMHGLTFNVSFTHSMLLLGSCVQAAMFCLSGDQSQGHALPGSLNLHRSTLTLLLQSLLYTQLEALKRGPMDTLIAFNIKYLGNNIIYEYLSEYLD